MSMMVSKAPSGTEEGRHGQKIIDALSSAWRTIQRRNRNLEIPDVVIVTGSGYQGKSPRNGHFWADRWHATETVTRERVEGGKPLVFTDEVKLPELFIAGERLSDGPEKVMQTLLHEAVHASQWKAGVQGTSNGGRYHNKTFALGAKRIGLAPPDRPDKSIGYSDCTIPAWAVREYADVLEKLEAANLANLRPDPVSLYGTVGKAGKGRAGKRVSMACPCGRRISLSPKQAELGLICPVCRDEFAEAL